MWVTGWYAGWLQNRMPPATIDYSVVTHVVHFAIFPRADGTLEVSTRPGFETAGNIAGVVNAVHAGGAKVLVTIGGAGTYTAFQRAIATGTRTVFVANLVAFVAQHNYDGLDIDMEPVNPVDYRDFRALTTELRAALPAGKLLTVAGASAAAIGPVDEHFDQINVMTYDMSGAFSGWVAWHNAPILSGGGRFPPPNDWREYPSAAGYLAEYLAVGIPAAKLSLGLDFYGYVWTGVTQPRQGWTQAPTVAGNVPYYDLIRSYDLRTAKWDDGAMAAYVSTATRFVSFDNERTAQAKVLYARAHGLGGICIWELCGGRLANGTDPLLAAVKAAAQPLLYVGARRGQRYFLNVETGAVVDGEGQPVSAYTRTSGAVLTNDGRTAPLVRPGR